MKNGLAHLEHRRTDTVTPTDDWVKFRIDLHPVSSAGGDGTISVFYDAGNGYTEYISLQDETYSEFSKLHFQYKTGTKKQNYHVIVDDIKVTSEDFIPPPQAELAVSPDAVIVGESATLSWSTANAESISIDQGIGSLNASGSMSVSPSETTTYIITASGAGGASNDSISIIVTNPYGTFSGTITDKVTSEPLQGVTVSVRDSEKIQADTTDIDGSFQIGNIMPGPISLSCIKDGYQSINYTLSISEGQKINLAVSMYESPTTASLRGIVTDGANGLPLQAGTVSVTDTEKTQSVEIQQDGSYEVSGITLGEVTITASPTGYESKNQQTTLTQAQLYIVNFTFESTPSTATLTGTITNSETLQPEAGVTVSLVNTDISEVTGLDGIFSLPDIPIGIQYVSVFKEDFISGTFGLNIDRDPYQLDIVFPLSTGVPNPETIGENISGYVYDAITGQPLEGAVIKVYDYQVTTGPNGEYTLTDLFPGPVSLIAMGLNHEAVVMYPTIVPGGADTFNFYITPTAEGSINGIVTDTNTSEPIELALISPGKASLVAAQSEGDGTYTMSNVPVGNHEFTASHPNYLSAANDSITVDQDASTAVNFTLTHKPVTGALEGLVTNKDTGTPIEGAVLYIESCNVSATTNSSGYYYLEDIPSGLVKIMIDSSGYPATTRTTAVNADKDYSTPTVTAFNVALDLADPTPPDSISVLMSAVDGGMIESHDKRFRVNIPPGALSADSILTLMSPTDGPYLIPGEDLYLDPELNLSNIKALGQMIQLVVEPATKGDPIPTIEGWVVLSGRYFESEADEFSLDESTVFPCYWDGTNWTLMQIKPYEAAVDEVNNQQVSVVNFSETETGNPIVAKLGFKDPILLASLDLDNYIPDLLTAGKYLFNLAAFIIEQNVKPYAYIYDKDQLNAVTSLIGDQALSDNALPLLIIHGWDKLAVLSNRKVIDPNSDPDYKYIVEDLATISNGVYRPMFATFNRRAGIFPIGNALAKQYDSLNVSGSGKEFSYLDTFGFSMGGLISRSMQIWNKRIHNMIMVGTPNHGAFSLIKYLYSINADNVVKVISPSSADLLPYNDEAPHALASDNPRLYLLNKNQNSSPQADMTLIAGTDGLHFPLLGVGENDKVVEVDSVFCRTFNPDDGDASLLTVDPSSTKYEYRSGFNHFNFGTEKYRIKDHISLKNRILEGLSDWGVSEIINTVNETFDENGDIIKYTEATIKVQFNTMHRDFDRLVLVIYGRGTDNSWHVGGKYVDPEGNVISSREVAGNSKEVGAESLSTGQSYSESQGIGEIATALIRLKPGENKVPLSPNGGFFLGTP